MKRTFIAVPFETPPALSLLINELKRKLKDDIIRWSDGENLHVTLKFLGDTPEEQIISISEILEHLPSAFKKIKGSLNGVQFFSNRGNPSVIYGRLEGMPEIGHLAAWIEKELDPFGFSAEERPFNAHLTLGRIKYPGDKRAFSEVISAYHDYEIIPLIADRLVFFESILRPQGPVYKPLKTVLFQET